MLLVVAPYGGLLPEHGEFLAGARKIRFVLQALGKIEPHIVLLNSGHQSSRRQGMSVRTLEVANDCVVELITPSTYENPRFGRLLNLWHVPSIVESVVRRFGAPKVAWFYNGYAFEMRVASLLKERYGSRLILEFEDWHFARNRGLNPKPLLDWLFWRRALTRIDHGFAVNAFLQGYFTRSGIASTLLPGLLSDGFRNLMSDSPPFQSETHITVGYFGGLTEEKGAGILLGLIPLVSENIRFLVTGKGSLEKEFLALSQRVPDRLTFLEAVSDKELTSAIGRVDVIVNPHEENGGVFPFKVLEALASGRLLISTGLPMRGFEWADEAIVFRSRSISEFFDAIRDSRQLYEERIEAINRTAAFVCNAYSVAAFGKCLGGVFKLL